MQAADAGVPVVGAAVSPPHMGLRAFSEPRDLCETLCRESDRLHEGQWAGVKAE